MTLNIQDHIRVVKDFPQDGINFYDIASLLNTPDIWAEIVDALVAQAKAHNVDFVLGLESRGFLVGVPVAMALNLPFGMIRKKGKLPGETLGQSYDLEYGTAEIEIQPDLIPNGARVLLVDDLLATGGTLAAAEKLVIKANAIPAASLCIIELDGLNGRDALTTPFEALIKLPA